MKKTVLLLGLAALTLASCTQESDPEPQLTQAQGIAFRPAMGAQSRATETTNSNLSSMYVTAIMQGQDYFDQLEFTKGTDGFFNSAKTYNWPGDETSIDFIAYSPSADDMGATITINNDTKTMEDYVTPEDIADQKDFITAQISGTGKEYGSTGVPLTFDHRLAQVEIRVKSDNTNYVYKVAGIRVGRPQTTGSFNFADNTWTLDDWHETAVYESSCTPVTVTSTPQSVMGESGNGMFIPQTLTPWSPTADPDNVAREAYLSILLNISTPEGVRLYPYPSDKQIDHSTGKQREYAWASVPLSGTWEQGKKYIYTLDLTDGAGNVDPDDPTPGQPVLGDPIKCTVLVNPWVDAPQSPSTTAIK